MHIYRFRSSGLMSQKSVLYDEMYFASTEELNDPIDMRSHFVFPSDSTENWSNVLRVVWGDYFDAMRLHAIASYLSSLCPIDYFDLLSSKAEIAENIFKLSLQPDSLSPVVAGQILRLTDKLVKFIELYQPNSGYSVSLSRSNNETLMWSHYASSHKGFCLIFNTINNQISQCKNRTTTSIEVTKGHSTSIPSDFNISEVTYNDNVIPIDAFTVFPAACSTLTFDSEEDRVHYHESRRVHLTTKSECWKYEEEARLLIESPSKHISGVENIKPYKRLFYYDFTQVVGIIFGARCSDSEKEALKYILSEKLKNGYSNTASPGQRIFFDFAFQEAELSSDSRKVKINNLGLIQGGNYMPSSSPDFSRQYSEWKSGAALVFQDGRCMKEYFK